MKELAKELRQRIDQLVFQGELTSKVLDLTRPVDCYILERMAFYQIESKLMRELGVDHLSEDSHCNCLIQMYIQLRDSNRIQSPPKYLPE